MGPAALRAMTTQTDLGWVFRGTRIPVSALFENLEDGVSLTEFVELFPGVSLEQSRLVLEHAACSYDWPMAFSRISHDPAVMGGKPCIRGLRITVGTIVGLMASGSSRERILQAYPQLELADIDEALAYAAWRMEEREEALVLS
jgi:uncharacterized protein (DUF433 family)